MLSTLLSKCFKAAFYLLLIGGLIKVIVDCKQQYAPLYEKNGFRYLSIQPGMLAKARRNNTLEAKAPDTLIQYAARHKDGNYTIGRIVSLRNGAQDDTRNEWLNHVRAEADGSEWVTADTLISVMGERRLRNEKTAAPEPVRTPLTGMDSLRGPLMISPLYMYAGTLSDSAYELLPPEQGHRIAQDVDLTESLRITPANNLQFAGFLLMDLLLFGSLAGLCLLLGRLFGHFSKQRYFTKENVGLLRNIGILLLIPQLSLALFYYLFLVNIHPVKWMIYHSLPSVSATYTMICGVEWVYVILGAGMIVLSYIFRQGLALQEDKNLTI